MKTTIRLPKEFIDSHHHFIDTNLEFMSFFRSFAPDLVYTAEQYNKDVKDELTDKIGDKMTLKASVHVEAMPDDGSKEVQWVINESIKTNINTTIKVFVGSVNLASNDAEDEMKRLKETSPNLVKGVRWMLDCVGKYDGKSATHIATTRHDGVDYLRGSNGGYDGTTIKEFESGFKLLEKYNLSFDLQCAPAQLKEGAVLFAKYPNIPVVIDHLGKPRNVLGYDKDTDTYASTVPDENELTTWREGMKAMAALPHVYVKISMLGYIIPGWIKDNHAENVLKGIVREVVDMFGPKRCMVATNWWSDPAASDSDFMSDYGPTPSELIIKISSWFTDLNDDDIEYLFSRTAKEFYRI